MIFTGSLAPELLFVVFAAEGPLREADCARDWAPVGALLLARLYLPDDTLRSFDNSSDCVVGRTRIFPLGPRGDFRGRLIVFFGGIVILTTTLPLVLSDCLAAAI